MLRLPSIKGQKTKAARGWRVATEDTLLRKFGEVRKKGSSLEGPTHRGTHR